MNDHWNLIDAARKQAGNDQEEFRCKLKQLLVDQDADTINRFDRWLQERSEEANRWDLWGAAYVMKGGCGDDSFDTFRMWLVSQGKDTFEKALANPESLATAQLFIDPEEESPEFEPLAYVPTEAYEEKTGEEAPWGPDDAWGGPSKQVIEGAGLKGTEWDEDALPDLFPKLCVAFDY